MEWTAILAVWAELSIIAECGKKEAKLCHRFLDGHSKLRKMKMCKNNHNNSRKTRLIAEEAEWRVRIV